MPAKYLFQSDNIKNHFQSLEEVYGKDFFKEMIFLYWYCFHQAGKTDRKSWLVRLEKKGYSKGYPLLEKSSREKGMVYAYLLADYLKKKKSHFWDDAIFIIYLTYYTALAFDGWKDLTTKNLKELENQGGAAHKVFQREFKFITRYNFNAKKSERVKKDEKLGKGFILDKKIKEKLITKTSNFQKKYGSYPQTITFLKESRRFLKKRDLT
jgi:hypothetical protein